LKVVGSVVLVVLTASPFKLASVVASVTVDVVETVEEAEEAAGVTDVDTAKGIVDQMIFVYKQAVNLASSLAPKAADGDQGIATSRVNIPSTPTPRPRPKGFSSPTPQSAAVTAPPTTPPAVPDAPSDSGWLVPALIVGGIAVAVGGVALVAATRGRGTA